MARAAPRPGLRPRGRPGLAWDLSPGPRPKLSSSAVNSGPAATARRHRPHRYPRPEPPARPRSPTPRAGRRRALPRPRCRPSGTVHRAVRREAVVPGNRRTPGSAAGGGCQERASGPAGGAVSLPAKPLDSSMEPGKRRSSSTSSDGDLREEHTLKWGMSQDTTSSPRLDRFKIARQLTDRAIKEKKIFSIYGHYPVIRAALQRKGWVEKKFHVPPKASPGAEDSGEGVPDSKCAEVRESQEASLEGADSIHDMMSRLVKNETPYLLWTIKRDVVDCHSLAGDQMLNHFGRTASFTTKIGLCLNMRNLPWYVQANPDSFFPRCYGLCTESEKQEFLDDFRRTAASSILKWVVSHQSYGSRSKTEGRREEARDQGNREDAESVSADPELRGLSGQLVDIACRVCQAYLGQLEHEDIDLLDTTEELTEAEWQDLMRQYYSLVHGGAFISNSGSYLSQCQALLNRISSVKPQTEIDGLQNIWIVKPAAKSRGRGITCMDRVEEILELVATEQPPTKDSRWVVQKYIETPLLIHDTKFDIRQWFLVTDWNPLTIWFYKESYLRFSTQRFSLDNLDSAIHLCNNSVQRHLQNDSGRSPLLPSHNMWTSSRFQEYLQKKGRGTVWGSVIYPSMKRAVSNAMRVAQDHVEARKNSFELYGADFILGRDFKPWLIEINSSPSMHPSTPVTALLCAQVQEDTIKVVLDRKLDRSCDIGNFELLWKQPAVEPPPFSGSDLRVEGVGVRKARKQTLPVTSFQFSAPLPSALADPARGPPRPPAPRGPRPTDGKALSPLALPGAPRRGCRKARMELPAYGYLHVDGTAPRGAATQTPAAPHLDPLLAPAMESRDMVEGALSRAPEATGSPSNMSTLCLVCQGCLPPAQACKRCRSFRASILQGTCFVPLPDARAGPCAL